MKKLILCLSLFCFFISCKDNDDEGCKEQITESHLPQWLNSKIAELEKDNYKAEIDLLTYSWGTAVFINPCTECADFYTYIYDNCGTQICQTGGFAGTTTCSAAYQEQSQKTLLWRE